MPTVGAYEAKTRLSALLDMVERGERVTITRHGRPVAVLVPAPGASQRTVDDAVAGILALRQGKRLGARLTVRDLIEEGRH